MARLGSLSMSKNGPIMYFSPFIAFLHLHPSSNLAGLTLAARHRPALVLLATAQTSRLSAASSPRLPSAPSAYATNGRTGKCLSHRTYPEPNRQARAY